MGYKTLHGVVTNYLLFEKELYLNGVFVIRKKAKFELTGVIGILKKTNF